MPVPAYKSILGTGKQTVADLTAALVARTKFTRFERAEFTLNQGYEYDPSPATQGPRSALYGPADARFEATLLGHTEGVIEHALLSLAGAVASANEGTGTPQPRKHTFTLADTVPAAGGYLSVEKGYGTSTEAQAANVAVSRIECRSGPGSLRFNIAGLAGKQQRVTKETAPTYSTQPPLPGAYARTVTIGGNTLKVRGLSWFVDHGNDPEGFDATDRFRKTADYQEPTAGFDVEALFDDMTQLRQFWGGASLTAPDASGTGASYAASLKVEGKAVGTGTPLNTVEFDAGSVVLDAHRAEIVGRNLIRQRITGRCLDDPTNGVTRIHAINSTTTI